MQYFVYYVKAKNRYVKSVSDTGKIVLTKSHLSAQLFEAEKSLSTLKALHDYFNGEIQSVEVSDPQPLDEVLTSALLGSAQSTKPVGLSSRGSSSVSSKAYGDDVKYTKLLYPDEKIYEVSYCPFTISRSDMVAIDEYELVTHLNGKLQDLYNNKVPVVVLTLSYAYDRWISRLKEFCQSRGLHMVYGNQSCIVVFRSQVEYNMCKKVSIVMYEKAYRLLERDVDKSDLDWATDLLTDRLERTCTELLDTSAFSAPTMKALIEFCDAHKYSHETQDNGQLRVFLNDDIRRWI